MVADPVQWSKLGTLFTGKLIRLAAKQSGDNTAIARWGEDAEYIRLMSDDPVRPQSAAQLDRRDERRAEHPDANRYEFMFHTLADDRLIGFGVIRDIQWSHQAAEIGIGIGEPENRGKGYGTDGMRLLVGYAFRELNLYRLQLELLAANARALRSYQKVGFQIEVIQRARDYRDGIRGDVLTMGLLRPEWEATQTATVSVSSYP